MAALQLRGWSKPNFAIGSEARLYLPRVTQLRSCSSSFRRNKLLVSRRDDFPTRRVPVERRVCASLSADDVRAACANALGPVINAAPLLLSRARTFVRELPPTVQLAAVSVALIVCAFWGLDSPMRLIWGSVSKVSDPGAHVDSDWEKCQTRAVLNSYIRPIVLWAGILALCRSVDMVELASEASTSIKLRLTHFLRSLATVSVFALCTGSLIQQVQKYLMKKSNLKDVRSVSLPFIGNAVSTSVWVAAVCLFLELLGFSTRRWLAAGGFGTVLITLAGREIFTNFLSSVMIHATKPFVESEWIQTKIEGQEVQGTVEHVGWWSPTVIRGDDREAVLIPNHKFSVSVVRNLTQKTHWRVKTHIALNHNDVKKVSKIVADMRKVLAKHPEIEQKRLHRRVFFDYVNSQNLALMIMVSCFVKTSRFEKYLNVKEELLMDLLKVVAHHGGRLATPVRSMMRPVEEPSEPQRPNSGREPILLTAVSSGDSKPQKVYQRQQSSKESSSVETVATVTTVSNDVNEEDSLSKLKKTNTVPATSVEPPPSDDEDDEDYDVKEPDNRRPESISLKDSSSQSHKDGSSLPQKYGSSQSNTVPATVEPHSDDEDDDVKEPDNRRPETISLKDGSSLPHKDGSSLPHKDGLSLAHKDGASPPHKDGPSLAHKDGPSLAHKDGPSLAHKDGPSLAHKGGSSLAHKGGSSLAHKGGSSLAHKGGSSLAHKDGSSLAHKGGSSLAHKGGSSLAHKGGSSLAHKGGSSLAHKGGSSLAHKGGSSLAHKGGSSLAHKDGSSLAHKDGSSLAHKDGSSLAHKAGSSLAHKGGSSLAHKGGSSLAHKDGSSQLNPVPATVEPPSSDDDVNEPDNSRLESVPLKDSSSQSHKDSSSQSHKDSSSQSHKDSSSQSHKDSSSQSHKDSSSQFHKDSSSLNTVKT